MKKFLSITAVFVALTTASMAQSRRVLASNESSGRNPHFIDGITLNNIHRKAEEEKTGKQVSPAKSSRVPKHRETNVANANTRPATAESVDTKQSPTAKNTRTAIPQRPVATNEPAVTLQERVSTDDFIDRESGKDPNLYAFIGEWYATPYLYGGETRNGIDCSSFTQHLFSAVYNTDLVRTAAEQYNSASPIAEKENLEKGDLVFFSINTSRISHVGFYLGNGKFVHASCSRGVMISDLNEPYWSRYFVAGGRIEKMKKKKSNAYCRN